MHESWPWKRELKLIVSQLSVWESEYSSIDPENDDSNGLEEVGFQIEKSVFLSAYVVRKLIENRKVTDGLAQSDIMCFVSKYCGPDEERIFGSDIKRDFDHANKKARKIRFLEVCNEIVHAKIFAFGTTREDSAIEGFWVCSDFNSTKRILYVQFEDWKSQIELVTEDSPVSLSARRDPITGKLRMKVE